jgi:hypothetical protein
VPPETDATHDACRDNLTVLDDIDSFIGLGAAIGAPQVRTDPTKRGLDPVTLTILSMLKWLECSRFSLRSSLARISTVVADLAFSQ